LHFDFSAVDASDSKMAYEALKMKVKFAITVFLREYQLALEEPIDYSGTPAMILGQLFSNIDFRRRKLLILVDEYDHFTNRIFASDISDFASVVSSGGFYRTFFEEIKQGAEMGIVARMFITGVSPITLDSMTSGFNIAVDLTRDLRYHEIVGFTRDEAVSLMDETIPEYRGKDTLICEMEKLYDGYQFCEEANDRLFNSEMVFYCLYSCLNTGKLPKNKVDKNIFSDFTNLMSITSMVVLSGGQARKISDMEDRKEAIANALSGEPLFVDLTAAYTLKKFDYNDYLSFLFYMGYLTMRPPSGDRAILAIPNKVAEKIMLASKSNIFEIFFTL
jgi:hypothetical protein